MRLPLKRAMALIKTASTEKNRELIYMMYLTYIPHMTKETKMSFREFYESAIVDQSKLDMRPTAAIMDDIIKIQQQASAKGVI